MQKQVNLPITVDSREKAQVFVFFFIFDSLILNQKKNSPLKTIVYWLWRGKNQKPETKKNPKVVGFISFLALLKKPKEKKTHHSGAFPEFFERD